jgi:tetratricopeptide (TPR) repeat protein
MFANPTILLVSLTHESGAEISINLFVDQKTTRQQQKLITFSQYVQQYPSGWKKRLELADLHYEMGDWEQAIEQYRQVIERQSHRLDLQLKIGKMLQLMGKKTEASTVYQNTLSLALHKAMCHHIKGLIAVCQDDILAAVSAFQSAISVEPDQAVHWLALGQVQMNNDQIEEALQAFDRILFLQPDDLIALIYSHDALIAIGNLEEARQRLEKAREIAPNDYQVIQRLIEHRFRLKFLSGEEGKETLKMIKSGLKLSPGYPDIHALLANYYVLCGEKRKGIKVLQEFTQQHPNHPRGWYYYAHCLRDVGAVQEATEAILKAAQLFPQSKSINQAKLEILKFAGKVAELV